MRKIIIIIMITLLNYTVLKSIGETTALILITIVLMDIGLFNILGV